MNKPVLSISLLSPGKDEAVWKCLESLKIFREELNTEIILVDTGCTEEIRHRMQDYVDIIVPFTWCNDFAKARNAGLEKSSGQWFLFIDDDEWFEDATPIVDFFKSGEYKKYHSATYMVRNYLNMESTIYQDTVGWRMVENTKDLSFKGKIHEYLYPFYQPSKRFECFVHHYGYCHQTEEDRIKKAKRNIVPLLEMVEEDPEEMKWYLQLVQEYHRIKEYENVIKICKKGLSQWETIRDGYGKTRNMIGGIYSFLMLTLEQTKQYEEEEKWFEKAWQEEYIAEPTRAFFALLAARLYSMTGDAEKGCIYLERYLDAYQRLKDQNEVIINGTAAITESVFQDFMVYPSLFLCFCLPIRKKDQKLTKKIMDIVCWDDKRMLHQEDSEKQVIEACCSMEYSDKAQEILQMLVKRAGKESEQEMYTCFLKKEIEYKEKQELDKLWMLRRYIANMDWEHRYAISTKILWLGYFYQKLARTQDEKNQSKEDIKALFSKLFTEYPEEIIEIKKEIWDIANSISLSLDSMFCSVDFKIWKKQIHDWSRGATPLKLQEWLERIETIKETENIRYDWIIMKCLEMLLYHSKEQKFSMEVVEKLLADYSNVVLQYYEPIHKQEVFLEEALFYRLPEQLQMAVYLAELKESRDNGSDQDVIKVLRKLTNCYELLNDTISYFAHLFQDEVANRGNEMTILAKKMKENIRILIQAGKMMEAKSIILQLEKIIPYDQELEDLKSEIK